MIIKRFEEIYALKKLFDELIKGKLLNGINYKNCNENFIRINEFLNEPILLAIVGTLTKDASTHLFSLFASLKIFSSKIAL